MCLCVSLFYLPYRAVCGVFIESLSLCGVRLYVSSSDMGNQPLYGDMTTQFDAKHRESCDKHDKAARVMPASQINKIYTTGLILRLCQANERRRYFVTASLIGWAQA